MTENRCAQDIRKCWLIAMSLGLIRSLIYFKNIGSIGESIGYFIGASSVIFVLICLTCYSWRWNKTDIQTPHDRKFVVFMGIIYCLVLLPILYGLALNLSTQSIGNALYNLLMLVGMIFLGKRLYKLIW